MFRLKQLLSLLLLLVSGAVFGQHIKLVENKGQIKGPVEYSAFIPGGTLFLEKNAFTYKLWDAAKLAQFHDRSAKDPFLSIHAFKMRFEGANPNPKISASSPYKDYWNFFLTDDTSMWASGVKGYQKVLYTDLYNGIDLEVEAGDGFFKYSFVVHPGANPNDIVLSFEGNDALKISEGRLVIDNPVQRIIENKPYSFQEGEHEKHPVLSSYRLRGNQVSFALGAYDDSKDLIIDPEVVFSTMSGSLIDNWGFTATYDDDGNAYSGGVVFALNLSLGYPWSTGTIQRTFGGGNAGVTRARDCAFLKYTPDGKSLLYTTLLGGRHNEQPHSMIVNSKQELVVLGTTQSANFPLPVQRVPYQDDANGGSDMFVVRFSEDGRRYLAGTFVGGDEEDGINGSYADPDNGAYRNPQELVYFYGDIYRGEVIVDADDNIMVASCTQSEDFPSTTGAFLEDLQGAQDGVVFKLDSTCENMLWSSYLGGDEFDAAYSLSVDDSGDVYITGGTRSDDFPRTNGAYITKYGGGFSDGFITHLSRDGSKLLSSSFIGTANYEQSYFVKADVKGNPWVFGQTNSDDFPTKGTTGNDRTGQFITQFRKDLSDIVVSRVFGRGVSPNIAPSAFSVDKCGRVYLSGWGGLRQGAQSGNTTGLNIRGSSEEAEQGTTDGYDFYIAVYAADLNELIYATYWGGRSSGNGEHVDGGTSRFDKRGVIYQGICSGCGRGSEGVEFPTTAGSHSTEQHPTTNCNAAVLKIDLEGDVMFSEYEFEQPNCGIPVTIDFTNKSINARNYLWDFGDGQTSTQPDPTHTYSRPGDYTVRLICYNPISCNLRDTFTQKVLIYGEATASFKATVDPCSRTAELDFDGEFGREFRWDAGSAGSGSGSSASFQFPSYGSFPVTLFVDESTDCADTITLPVVIDSPEISITVIPDTCLSGAQLKNLSQPYDNGIWKFPDGSQSDQRESFYNFRDTGTFQISFVSFPGLPCSDTVQESITIDTLRYADFNSLIDTCKLSFSASNSSEGLNRFRWTLEGKSIGTGKTADAQLDSSGKYRLSLFGESTTTGCKDSLSLFIELPKLPVASGEVNRDTCINSRLLKNTSFYSSEQRWVYQGVEYLDSTVSLNFPYKGKYEVLLIAYSEAGCPDSQYISVPIDTVPIANFAVGLDSCMAAAAFADSSIGALSFRWDLGNGEESEEQNPNSVYPKRGSYTATLTINKFTRCERDTAIGFDLGKYAFDDILIPNFFSPNDDGINDVMDFKFLREDCDNYTLLIFNRWGQPIFEGSQDELRWDGKNEYGAPFEPGVYFYLFKGERHQKHGSVHIVR